MIVVVVSQLLLNHSVFVFDWDLDLNDDKKHCCLSGNSNPDENCHGLSVTTAATKSDEYYYCLVENV